MSEIEPVQVHIASIAEHAMLPAPAPQAPAQAQVRYRARYETFVLTADDPVQCILPEDPDRVEAYVIALDNDVVIGTRNQVSATQNTAASVPRPIGAYVPSKTTAGSIIPFCVRDCDAVYAGATTTVSSRVSVAAYYRS